jgi:hypothetical protein
MIEWLTAEIAKSNAATGVGGCSLQHLEKDGLRQMEAAARRKEQATAR